MAPSSMKKAGWVWEGCGFDPGVMPTIYGVGEGATYFGVDGANYIFHDNNEIAFAKLAHVPRMTADISNWYWYETTAATGRFTFAQGREADPEKVAEEAGTVSRLSLSHPNVTGAFIDDTHGIAGHENYVPDAPRRIKETLCGRNPDLDLWIVVYTHEFDKDYWRDWLPHVDVINLWVWECGNLAHIEEYIRQCRKVFPDKRLVMGVYIRDYPSRAGVPRDLLEIELNAIAKHLEAGDLDGFNILGACLIDQHPEQAEFIRDFISRH